MLVCTLRHCGYPCWQGRSLRFKQRHLFRIFLCTNLPILRGVEREVMETKTCKIKSEGGKSVCIWYRFQLRNAIRCLFWRETKEHWLVSKGGGSVPEFNGLCVVCVSVCVCVCVCVCFLCVYICYQPSTRKCRHRQRKDWRIPFLVCGFVRQLGVKGGFWKKDESEQQTEKPCVASYSRCCDSKCCEY